MYAQGLEIQLVCCLDQKAVKERLTSSAVRAAGPATREAAVTSDWAGSPRSRGSAAARSIVARVELQLLRLSTLAHFGSRTSGGIYVAARSRAQWEVSCTLAASLS